MAKEAEVQDSEIYSSHGGQSSTSDIITDTPLQTNVNSDQQQPLPLPPQIQLQHQLQEPIDPNSCIIIHPGSRNLRLGRPSDSVPFTVLHAIAWRQKNACDTAKRRVDPFIVPLAKMSSDRLQEVEECRLKVSRLLQSSLMSDGTRRYATPPKQVSAHNKRVSGELDSTADPCPELVTPTEEYITGSQVSRLSPDAPYHVHFPWQRGDLHCHSGLSGSLNSVVADLDRIWTQAIEEKLGIPKNEFHKYGCCVVIPDLYNRDHVARITDLLLTTMGFAACFVFQDHVAATFGSGLGSACVVDVGDQKTSVSCVEDALSVPSTRLRLQYGGSDVSQVLHWLLRKTGFPRPLQPDADRADAALLADVKHTHCHLDLDMCGPQERRIRVERPGCKPLTYTLQLGDELLITPLSLCYPALLQLTGDKTPVLTQTPNPGHSEDPWDETYLRETSRRGGKETAEVLEVSGGGDGGDEDMVVEDSMPPTPTPSTASNSSSNINNSSSYNNISNGKQDGSSSGTLSGLLSLEQAIHTSIERCPEEGRRRMYSTILLVGAGAGFPHLGRWLQGRLLLNIPVCYRPEQVEVITRAKDLEPGMIAWKGAALMTGLEGSGELWISRSLWARQGVRALREKCPFIW